MATFDIDDYLRTLNQGQASAAAPQTPGAAPSAAEASSGRFYSRPITARGALRFGARGLLAAPSMIEAFGQTAAIGRGEMTAVDTPGNRAQRAFHILTGGLFRQAPTQPAAPAQAAPAPAAAPAAGSIPAPAAPPGLTDEQRAAAVQALKLQAAREAAVQAASPEAGGTGIPVGGLSYGARRRSGLPSARGFGGAILGLKQIAGDNARQATQQKLLQELFLKLPGIQKDAAETNLLNVRGREAEKARLAGATPAEIAAIAAGRASGESFTGFPDLTGQNFDVLNRRTGDVTRVKPKVQVTEADIQATMKANKMTREQVVARLKQEGRM